MVARHLVRSPRSFSFTIQAARTRFILTHLSKLLLLVTFAVAADVVADDWPQYRGPQRDGISQERGLLSSWSERVPAELWRIPLGEGFSGVAAVGGRLYTMDSRGEEEFVVSLEAASGRELWRTAVGRLYREPTGNGPRSTPTVEGEMLWALSSFGNLTALRTATGERVWSVDIAARFGTQMLPFGFAAMPLIVGDHLVLEVGGADGYSVVGFDKRTGDIAWHTATEDMAYTSPIRFTWKGVEQLVFLNSHDLVSLAPQGELLWSVPFSGAGARKVAMPVFVAPDSIFVSASYDVGGMVVRMKSGLAPGQIDTEVVWENRRLRNHFSTSVAYGGRIYGFDNATLKCLDAATGEQLWAQRGGFGKGSLIYADGQLIVLTEQGKLLLVKATGEAYWEKGALELFDERTWAPPTLADGHLYVRSASSLVGLDLRAASARQPLIASFDVRRSPSHQKLEELSDVDAVVARYLEARGGIHALNQIKILRQEGKFLYHGEAYRFTSYYKHPNRYRFEFELPNGKLSILSYDGTHGWRDKTQSWKPFATDWYLLPLAEIPAEDLPLLVEDDADFEGPLVNYRSKGHEVELVGAKELEDTTPVYHLRVKLKSGHIQNWYIDRKTFTVVRRTAPQVDPMGFVPPYERNWYIKEYRRVAGILIPTAYEREDFQLVRTFAVERAEVNVDLDDELFTMPSVAVTVHAEPPANSAETNDSGTPPR